MFLSEETYRAAIVVAMNLHGTSNGLATAIKETVDALIAADRKLSAYEGEAWKPTSESL